MFRFTSVAAAAGGALWEQRLRASPQQAPSDQNFWNSLRDEFPLEKGLLFLNAANVCPASKPVINQHLDYLHNFYANPSFENRARYDELEAGAREKLARLSGAKPAEIAITRNTSESTNTIVRGLNLRAGDEIIISSHNHPSNNASWKVLAKRQALVLHEVPTPIEGVSAERLIRSIQAAVTSRTRVIAITHVTNTTGVRYPAKEIAELARGKDIWVHLDGAQSLGMLDFRLPELGCHSYAASMHKWPMGPLETGVLYVREGWQDKLWPAIVTAGYSELIEGAGRFGVLGQRDNPRIVAAGAAADFLLKIGMSNVQARTLHLAAMLKRKLLEIPRIQMLTPQDDSLSAAVLKFRITGKDTRQLGRDLWQKHRISGAVSASGPLEGIRWCPHIYNTEAEIQQAVDALRDVAA